MNADRSTPKPDHEVERIFLMALELPESERDAWIIQACAGDEAMQAEVAALLDADADNADGALSAFIDRPVAEAPISFGDYEFQAEIAHGSMGAVYRAVHEPTGRLAAVKLLRNGFESETAELRFQVEAETLARLNHDGIARIYDAGFACVRWPGREQRRAFIAMELVEGVDLRSFASSRNDRQKLSLVAQVARALAHAHQRGVIHRDLKPANILVTADGVPKIIDFGVSRRSDRPAGARDLTYEGQLIGSLRYMSPEQARGHNSAVDTRSDVYALGVILFELLSGETPHDLPALPTPDAVAKLQTEPAQLRSRAAQVSRDVEAIVQTALALNPADRYASAAALAQDIEDYLNDRPIVARPPTLRKQLGRMARQHRVAAAGVGLILFALAGIALSVSLYASRLGQEVQAKQRAVEDATATIKFLDEMLRSVEPRAVGRDVSLLEVLEKGAHRLHTLDRHPTIQSEMRALLLHAFTHQGVPADHAHVPPQLWSDEVTPAEAGSNPSRTEIDAMFQRAKSYSNAAEHHLADTGLRAAARWYRKTLGPTHRQTLRAEAVLADHLSNLDFESDGLQLLKSVVKRSESALGKNDRDTLEFSVELAVTIYHRFGDVREARALSESLVPRLEAQLGPDHRTTLRNAVHLSRMLNYTGHREDAVRLLEKTVQLAKIALGAEHGVTLLAGRQLALAYQSSGRREKALREYERLLPMVERAYGERDRRTALTRAHWARLLIKLGRAVEAEHVARQNIEQRLFEWQLERGRDIAHSWSALGQSQFALGRRDEGLVNLHRALQCARLHNPSDHVETAVHLITLAEALMASDLEGGRPETTRLIERAYKIVTTKCGHHTPAAQEARRRLTSTPAR
ncbi:MAG: serine/threonine-protein kinase [Phycisphaerales bacterium]|nr:serine/threonine-protein kinase [Phycisphaerales bacterium]